jgi:hypothetical protein
MANKYNFSFRSENSNLKLAINNYKQVITRQERRKYYSRQIIAH